MSESSLPPFGPAKVSFLPRAFILVRLKEMLQRLCTWPGHEASMVRTSALELRAEQSVREYLDANAEPLERAVRLKEKTERLEKAGIPSESARNRAERARAEVTAGLSALRASFIKAAGERAGAPAFDRAVELLYPDLTLRR